MVFDATCNQLDPKENAFDFGFYFFTVLCVSIHLSFGKEAYSKCETFFTPKLITTFLDFQVCMHFKMFTKCKVLHPMLCSQSVSVLFVMYAHLSMCKYYREMMVMVSTWALLTDIKRNTTWNLTSTLSGRYKSEKNLREENRSIHFTMHKYTHRIRLLSTFNFSAQSTISSLRFLFTKFSS